ncbi:MAG TPA: DUF952 domain-containing protein [Phenylobacterium sp.]|nr:DUF952 domain-containing protein [Phenylobacterium sp.]
MNGLAIGGGVVRLLAGDLRLAADEVWFSIPEVELDLPQAQLGEEAVAEGDQLDVEVGVGRPEGLQPDLVVLEIEADDLAGADLRWEPSRGGALFPHLYEPLGVGLVREARPAPLDAAGLPRLGALS